MKVMVLVAWAIMAVLPIAGSDVRVAAATTARPAQATHTCRNTQLRIRSQSSQGAAGHIAIIYRMHNQSSQACTLFGYPGVQLLGRHFLSLPTTVHRGPGGLVGAIPKQLVHLAANGNAYFALGYSDVPVKRQPCAMAYYLMIFAPNDVLPVVTYASRPGGAIIVCAGDINVSPVTAQPRYR